MPNVLFRLPQVDANIQAGLREFLPNYHDGLNELRLSAQVVKHVYDSRPDISREVLQKVASGEVRPTEVLPNHQFPDRALLVYGNIKPSSKRSKDGAMAIEISANGRGVDAITLMTVPSGTLRKARELAEQKRASRSEGRQLEANAARPTHFAQDQHANPANLAADNFPVVDRDNISLPLTQDLSNLAEIANDMPNHPIEIDGEIMTLSDAVKRLDAEARDTEAFSKSFEAATNCKLRRG